jgi:ornithine cyclodeaminase/alanine dehydrogenase-like protein (mu-crystallin family)
MLLLPERTVAQLLRGITPEQFRRLLQALTQALAKFALQKEGKATPWIHQPQRSHITTKDGHVSLFMPASDTTATGIKIVTVAGKGNGGINGVINIFSPEGRLKGLLSATEVTAFRTALATMSLLTHCRHILPAQERIVIFGAGKQAEWHARLALLVLHAPDSEVKSISITFVNRSRERLGKLAHVLGLPELQRCYPALREVNFLAREDTPDFEQRLRSVVSSSDMIFCCTPSTQPLFPHSYLDSTNEGGSVGKTSGDDGTSSPSSSKSRFLALIGSYQPHMQEVESATLLSGEHGTIFVDSKEACLKEAGELIMAKGQDYQLVEVAQLFSPDDHGASAAARKSPGVPVRPGRNVIFKCVGMGIMDLVVGKVLLEIAHEMRLGTWVGDF